MNWNDFLKQYAGKGLFNAATLEGFSGPESQVKDSVQTWYREGKLAKVFHQWYMIKKPWRTVEVPLPVVANAVVIPSYISVEWALGFYGMIPEPVPNPTSMTTQRRALFSAVEAIFIYHHVPNYFFTGFKRETVEGYSVNMACPEKALLDKIYMYVQDNPFSILWLEEMGLQLRGDFKLKQFRELAKSVEIKNFDEVVDLTCDYIGVLKRRKTK